MSVLVSYGCYNKVPKIVCFKTAAMYCLTVLEARSQKAVCWQGYVVSEGAREDCSGFSLLVAFSILDLQRSGEAGREREREREI